MGKDSKIQWTQDTINFWTGCEKVSQGCKFCYMYRDQERWGKDPSEVIRTKDGTFYKALSWKEPRLIFTCSWSDFFIEDDDEWRDAAWDVIKRTPHHTWQILTKRPERILKCLPDDWDEGYENVWLGFSAEDQLTYEERLLHFIDLPAKVKFISCEPLLAEMDLAIGFPDGKGGFKMWYNSINWVIVGGESGKGKIPNDPNVKYKYRECTYEWIYNVIANCQIREVPVFVKQLGTHLAKTMGLKDKMGGNIDEFPPSLQIREFPKEYQVAIAE